MSNWYFLIVVPLELIFLYLLSRITIKNFFRILRRIFHHEHIVYVLISLIFLPGTILHELSHFFMAIILFLRVRDIKILPEWQGNYIKLGSVHYEKKDVIRSIIVGVAPIIGGLLFFWWFSTLKPLSTTIPLWLNLIFIYTIFVVSTTMFSSKQDLVDIVYIIPVILLIGVVIYIFQINTTSLFSSTSILENLSIFLYSIVDYLSISLAIHIVLVVIINLLLKIFK